MNRTPAPAPIRAVAYFRKSDDDGGKSIEQQKAELAAAREREGVVVVGNPFEDQAVPGWQTAKRTGFHRMLAFCQEQHRLGNPVEAVVCYSADRFSRSDSLETAAFLHQFREAGVRRMLTVDEGWIDFDSPEERMIFGLKQEAGRSQYVRNLSRVTRRGMAAAAANGLWCGGQRPYGYNVGTEYADAPANKMVLSRKLVLHPTEADVVRWMFTTYATSDVSIRGIIRQLHERGIVSPKGRTLWLPTTVMKILRNVIYVGDLVFGRMSYSTFAGRVRVPTRKLGSGIPIPEGEWVRKLGTHEALVSQEVFDTVQRRLAGNRGRTSPRKNAPFPLSGLLVCGHCGRRMITQSPRQRHNGTIEYLYRVYCCSSHHLNGHASGCQRNAVDADRMVSAVVAKLAAALDNPAALAAIRAEALRQEREAAGDEGADVRRLETREAYLNRKVMNLTERLGDDLPDDVLSDVRDRLRKLSAERQAVRSELATLKAGRVSTEELEARVERIVALARQLRAAARKADPAALSLLLREVVERVEVYFTHAKRAVRTRSEFANGMVYWNSRAGLTSVNTNSLPAPAARQRRNPRLPFVAGTLRVP